MRRQTVPMLLYVVYGVGGGDGGLVDRGLLGLSFGKGMRISFLRIISPRVSLPFSRTECFAVQLVERYRAGDN